jgi:Icc-related predicted phosphoesterase
MRVLFLSDFHGHMPDVSAWAPELILAGGDYCEVDEIRQLKFAALARGLRAIDWPQLVSRPHAEELMDRALAEGSAVVSALAESGVPVLAIPGNSDRVTLGAPPEMVAAHLPRPDRPEVEGSVANIETRVVDRDDVAPSGLGGWAFAGLGGWSGPPNEERLRREIGALTAQSSALAKPLVLVSHNVPWRSELDGVRNPDLPAFAQGQMVGSHRCLAALAALSPKLCLTGHLHENYGRVQRIGDTLCLCGAGAYRGDGVLIELHPDGSFDEPRFVTSPSGAQRVLV